MSDFQLNHLNIPARDPEGLVRWYAQSFGLKAGSVSPGRYFRSPPRPALATLTPTWAIRTDLTGPKTMTRQGFDTREFLH